MATLRSKETTTRLERFMRAMGITPGRLLSEIRVLARSRKYSAMSERHLRSLRSGEQEPTPSKIRTIVAAIRRITSLHISATDLFDIEPDTAGLVRRVAVFWVPRSGRAWRPPLTVQQLHPAHENAFETLYLKFAPVMSMMAQKRWDVPREDAEAVVHDVFISFLEREPQVDNVQAYLLAATKYACGRYWRDRGRELRMPDELHDVDASVRQEQWALRRTMMDALARVGARCLDTLHRFYVDCETVEQLGRQLKVTPETVYQILYGCRKQLRAMVFGAKR